MNTDLIKHTFDLIASIEDGTASKDDVLQAINVRDAMKSRVKEVSELFDAALLPYIQQHGDLDTGTIRYYVGIEKKRKLKDLAATVDAILETGGAKALTMCLGSDPLKVTGVRATLGEDEAEKHYDITEVPDLKTGKPKLSVKKTMPEEVRK